MNPLFTVSPSYATFSWLQKLRWFAVLGQIALLLGGAHWFGLDVDTQWFAAVCLLTALSNVFASFIPRQLQDTPLIISSILLTDILLLTALLFHSGGAQNPFSIVYLLHVVLFAVLLGSTWAWLGALMSVLLFGMLYSHSAHSMHHHAHDMNSHLFGMWVAFSFVAALCAYFVSRITSELKQTVYEKSLLESSQRRLASLTTLAAGAAHELSTPLNTIVIALEELQNSLSKLDLPSRLHEDCELIASEVTRCREIIIGMGAYAGEVRGDTVRFVSIEEFLELLRPTLEQRFKPTDFILSIEDSLRANPKQLPLSQTLLQSIIAITKNAIEANGYASRPIEISLIDSSHDAEFCIEIKDFGPGIDKQHIDKVGEPFFSTKEPGDGMGLGVFLARLCTENLNGRLLLTSAVDQGTIVQIRLPFVEQQFVAQQFVEQQFVEQRSRGVANE